MSEMTHFKSFVLYSADVTVNMNHFHIKKIHFVDFSYIVIGDTKLCT
jgi:hypothetical protein